MKFISQLLFLFCVCSVSLGQVTNNGIAIIPEPVKIETNTGHFTLPSNLVIESPAKPEMKEVLALLKTRLSVPTGSKVMATSNVTPSAAIKLLLNKKEDAVIGKEGYYLKVTPKNI
ncbi:MAG: glycoside hydrolase family 20 zincin-like fold domain-containing protein, partial [Ginsengibacter sp.]